MPFFIIFVTMRKELSRHLNQIKQLCDHNKVKTLFAFGSVVRNDFNSQSDIDLIVDIDSSDPFEYSDNYFNLKIQLEKLLNRKIDLLEYKSLKNPYLKKQIDHTKVLIYG